MSQRMVVNISTPLGVMHAVSGPQFLTSLSFVDGAASSARPIDLPAPIKSIIAELESYFVGDLTVFETPLRLEGTQFQQSVWRELQKIPFGETISYGQLATAIGNPKAFRAVAQANGANRLPIIIPCHRVINANGALGGYNAGVDRKRWLLKHENQ